MSAPRLALRRLGKTLKLLPALIALFAGPAEALGQNPDPAELTTQENQPEFKLRVERNLVPVRVIVRDSKGQIVRNLDKDDFRIFDSGKLQTITYFSVEVPSSKSSMPAASGATEPANEQALPETARPASTPQRYLGLYFDDVHMKFEDVARTRDAADRYLVSSLRAGDRVGIFTASGQTVADFTDNLGKLHEALFHLLPRPIAAKEISPCPDILEYQAYKIVHEHDPYSIEIATEEALYCQFNGDRRYVDRAQQEAEVSAVRTLTFSETEAAQVLRGLEQLVRRMSVLPGQRSLVLVSPGFLTLTLRFEVSEIADRALRSEVIISTFDSKGLYATPPLGDASERASVLPQRADMVGHKTELYLEQFDRNKEVLRDTAFDTGGEFFQNSNDYDQGFQRVGALPEVYYVLGFSPKNLKYDGRFHNLKVELVKPARVTLRARRGYFAPKIAPDAAAQAKEEIEDAVFSQAQVSELPLELHTQFFKINEKDVKLSVLAHLDVRFLRFRKSEGRNLENLTVVTVLFDRDGKYLTANEKRLEFRLRDGSLERLFRSGLTMKTSFDVKPGTYQVRQVVRDAEGGHLSGLSRTVEIPF
ncbi:MAG: hypothetical protein DMG23_02395 [Acidobacteria bacterium]|nr:MAG: hypothetical protein DMG23_02395 [Acidobacteriota bacterium]